MTQERRPAGVDARSRNEALTREYVRRELHAGRDELEACLARRFRGLLGKVAVLLYHAIGEHEIRKRLDEHLTVVAKAARDAETDGLDAAIARWTPEALDREEVVHRGHRDHPRFPEVERLLAEAFRRRVAAMAPLFAHEGEVATYDELVRAVYPDRSVPEAFVREDLRLARRVLDLLEKEPGLLRFPRPLLTHLFPVARDLADWYERRVDGEFDRVYGVSGGSGAPARPTGG